MHPEQATADLAEALARAQALHTSQPELAADLLLGLTPELIAAVAPSQRDELLRLTEHVLLGHLDAGDALADWLPQVEGPAEAHPASAMACRRSRAALALARGEAAALDTLPPFMQVLAHFNPTLAHTRRRDYDGARGLMLAATTLAEAEPGNSPTGRALAALANNVAGDLRQSHQRGDAAQAALMLHAARLARHAWGRVGAWLETERADWQLAMCAATVGDAPLARTHADAALAACEAHAADDFEFCFAWQAMALAALTAGDAAATDRARTEMAQRADRLGEDQAGYARSCLAEIDQQRQALAA